MRLTIILTVTVLASSTLGQRKAKDLGLDFDFDDEENEKPEGVSASAAREQQLQDSLLRAMQKPALREQIGQVIPILRVMSPQQRLTLAALVSAQIMAPQHQGDDKNLAQVAHMFSGPGQTTRNVSEQLLLPISMDIAKMFRGIASDAGRSWRAAPGSWSKEAVNYRLQTKPPNHFNTASIRPDAQNASVLRIAPWKQQTEAKTPNDITRRNGIDDGFDKSPNPNDCDFLTTEMCQEVTFYPEAEILGSIQQHLMLMEPFLTEFGEMQEEHHEKSRIQKRRDDGNDLGSGEGFMCPSTVKYAKPKRARTTSGNWKYIVNTGDYSQTLRLEICLKSGASCSYLNDNFRSVCNQVFNYHRLMCWDEKKGLHMDVFKVPSCCSCHVQGYATKFPQGDFPFADKRKEVVPPLQSNSGVKREIPRPNIINGRPEPQLQNFLINAGKRENQPIDFHVEETPEQSQTIPHRLPQRPLFQQPGAAQAPILPLQPQGAQRHPLHNLPNQQPTNFNPRPQGLPQYNQIGQPQFPGNQRQPERQQGYPQQHHQPHNNLELNGGAGRLPNDGLTDHLVPPGPPLPLDFDRPRPSFDHRRRNGTANRGPEYNVVMEPSNSKRGTQRFEQTQPAKQTPPKPARPVKRPLKPIEPITAENNRVPFKSQDGNFGSKLRGQKPHKPAVFVTPTPIPVTDRAEYENTLQVTPKPHHKNGPKKVNYNYHPIIDFFAQTTASQQNNALQFNTPSNLNAPVQYHQPPQRHNPPVQFNQVKHQPSVPQPQFNQIQHQPSVLQPQFNQIQHKQSAAPQFSQPQLEQQHIAGAHEWTPMV